MNVRCEASNTGSDIRCKVCGQGFLLHWQAETSDSREEEPVLRAEVQRELRRHHARATDHPASHPRCSFQVQLAEPEPHPSLPTLLEAAPSWAAV